ncbi:hypothetical protein [Burkholderia sola]|uniref:hypothetical protein n=1 Tax=Burkholderia sola TaxID=2843302 RepID=UPI0033901DBB
MARGRRVDEHAVLSVLTVRHHWRENLRAAIHTRRALIFAEGRMAIDRIRRRQHGGRSIHWKYKATYPNKIVPLS